MTKKHNRSEDRLMRGHSMLKASKRQRMVASRVFEIMSMTLLQDVTDPSLEKVSLTHVDMSGDLQIARIYFAAASEDVDLEAALDGFKRAESFFRRSLSRSLSIKKTPELRFYADENIYASWHLEKILEQDSGSEQDK